MFAGFPKFWKAKKAKAVFLKENTREAKKILAVEEITTDKLKDVPYEILAQELAKRLVKMSHKEVLHLKQDAEYAQKRDSLQNVFDELKFVLDNV